MGRRKTRNEFIDELYEINPNILVLGDYINAQEKILIECLLDNHQWSAKPIDLLHNHGCPLCKKNKLSKLKQKDHTTFIQQISEIHPNIIILNEYIGCGDKIQCKCLIDGYTWSTTPTKLLNGHGCIECHRLSMFKSNEQFLKELELKNKNILALDNYIGSNVSIRFKCLTDNTIWSAKPNSILNGQGCPKCGLKSRSDKRRKNHDSFINELRLINNHIIIKGEYMQNKKPILCECVVDGTQWYATPNNLLRGSKCPTCNITRGENKIRMYLENNNINYIYQKKYDDLFGVNGGILSYDFLIDNWLLVEYQGQFHDGTAYQYNEDQFKIQQMNDKIKFEYAKHNNINLLEIWYWDYDNIEKILEEYLNNFD